MIQFDLCKSEVDPIFQKEIESAIKWLVKIQDRDKYGWGWVQHIPPNEQNTAEVVCALLSYDTKLSKELRISIFNAINNYLFNPEKSAKITIDWAWVLRGLQFFENNLDKFVDLCDKNTGINIEMSKLSCVKWLIDNQNSDGGWADIKGDLSSVIRTSLCVIVLSNERDLKIGQTKVDDVVDKAIKWIIKTQNTDGGWGNVRQDEILSQFGLSKRYKKINYELISEIPYENIECQYLSNAACSGYAILALNSVNFHKFSIKINQAIEYIKKSQQKNGGWPIFCEVGSRAGITFTFRHFSTTWALNAMIETNLCDYSDECVLNGIDYLLSLQDQIYGGWKSSFDSDSYTWSTCNALEILSKVQTSLKEIKAKNFLYIVKEWWKLKAEKDVHSWSIFNTVFTFNTQTWSLFCIIYTLLLLTWDILLIINTGDIFFTFKDNLTLLKIIKAFVGFVLAIFIGVPWVILIKNAFIKEMTWLSSISWIYGIITGILIAFYGFIIN